MISTFSEPHNLNVSAEQPWVDSRFSLYDSDIEFRSFDGFIFQLHRAVLGASSGTFPGSEMATGGEIVPLTEPANVLAILLAFLYPKPHPELRGEGFELLAAVAEAAAKYEVFSAVDVCNERLVKYLPQHAPAILVHAIKHDYRRLISETLPHFVRAPLVSTLEKLPPGYMLPYVRYHETWRSLFKELAQYSRNIPKRSSDYNSNCHERSRALTSAICWQCRNSLYHLVAYLEDICGLEKLREMLRSPTADQSLNSLLVCCNHDNFTKPLCPHIENLIKLCQEKIEKLPQFASFLGLKL